MPRIELETIINAPIERVFDLSRSIDLHADSMSHTDEKAVDGVTKGLISLGETVTWEATHFGIKQRLTSKITICERPTKFGDTMVSGAFARFDHEHFFEEIDGKTVMRDAFDYDSPLGFLGKMADFLFLENYMKNLLIARNETIKRVAESDEWRKFLNQS
ncbi:MAG: SRPBCC family protein [Pyrinomonadaceae bacterium]|nr:SRPBCC family protein [Pyrinomonadaceae bacterium]